MSQKKLSDILKLAAASLKQVNSDFDLEASKIPDISKISVNKYFAPEYLFDSDIMADFYTSYSKMSSVKKQYEDKINYLKSNT